jgi:hypothetical protein
VKRLVLGALLVIGCKGSAPKPTMTPQEVIGAMKDLADRGCVCSTDKECFREIRDEWEQTRKSILYNAALLQGDDKNAYEALWRCGRSCCLRQRLTRAKLAFDILPEGW